MKKKVSDLQVGEIIPYHKTTVVVRQKLSNKVMVSKTTATGMNGLFSIPYYSHLFDDLMNRVEVPKVTIMPKGLVEEMWKSGECVINDQKRGIIID